MAIQPRNEKVKIFVDYILETYISNESNFPPILWAEYSASTMRTTNSCEAFHSKFNAFFYIAHPNTFVFIDVLKNMQKDTYIKLRSIHLNARRTNIIEKETFIRNIMKRLGWKITKSTNLNLYNYYHTSFYQCHNTYFTKLY